MRARVATAVRRSASRPFFTWGFAIGFSTVCGRPWPQRGEAAPCSKFGLDELVGIPLPHKKKGEARLSVKEGGGRGRLGKVHLRGMDGDPRNPHLVWGSVSQGQGRSHRGIEGGPGSAGDSLGPANLCPWPRKEGVPVGVRIRAWVMFWATRQGQRTSALAWKAEGSWCRHRAR